jgi:hypothetical protein
VVPPLAAHLAALGPRLRSLTAQFANLPTVSALTALRNAPAAIAARLAREARQQLETGGGGGGGKRGSGASGGAKKGGGGGGKRSSSTDSKDKKKKKQLADAKKKIADKGGRKTAAAGKQEQQQSDNAAETSPHGNVSAAAMTLAAAVAALGVAQSLRAAVQNIEAAASAVTVARVVQSRRQRRRVRRVVGRRPARLETFGRVFDGAAANSDASSSHGQDSGDAHGDGDDGDDADDADDDDDDDEDDVVDDAENEYGLPVWFDRWPTRLVTGAVLNVDTAIARARAAAAAHPVLGLAHPAAVAQVTAALRAANLAAGADGGGGGGGGGDAGGNKKKSSAASAAKKKSSSSKVVTPRGGAAVDVGAAADGRGGDEDNDDDGKGDDGGEDDAAADSRDLLRDGGVLTLGILYPAPLVDDAHGTAADGSALRAARAARPVATPCALRDGAAGVRLDAELATLVVDTLRQLTRRRGAADHESLTSARGWVGAWLVSCGEFETALALLEAAVAGARVTGGVGA